MRKFVESVIDTSGNCIASASIQVNVTGGAAATIYSDDGVTPKANPTTADANGRFSFYVADGRYDLVISGSGLTTYTLSDVEVSDAVGTSSSADSNYKVNKIQVGDGAAAIPSIAFQSATGTGFSLVSGSLTASVGGTAFWKINSSGVLLPQTTGTRDIGAVATRIANLYVNAIPAGCTLTSPTITTPTISDPAISGVTSMASATLTGLVTNYNSIATVGNGIPFEVATVDVAGQTAAIVTATLYAVPASGAGQYRLNWNAKITTAGTTSTLGSLTIVYTDPDGVAVTITAPASIAAGTIATTSTANTTGTVLLGLPLLLNCKLSTNITYAFAYASTGTAMQYNAHLRLESL